MLKKATEQTHRSREVNVPKERGINADNDVCDVLRCYIDSNGNIKTTISLLEERHGIKTTEKVVNEIISSNMKRTRLLGCHGNANGAVKVEEESEYSPDTSAVSNAFNILKQENCHLLADTYVYTTRLEDMQIFNTDFSNLSVKTIEKRIILESKPDKSKIQINNCRYKNRMQTKRLIEKIGKLNAMIRKQAKTHENSLKVANDSAHTDICRESLELYKLCKSLTVPLLDCLKYPLEITKSNNKLNNNNLFNKVVLHKDRTSQTLSNTAIPPIDERVESVNSYAPKQLTRIAAKINQDVYFVMKNMFSNNTEIYYVPYESSSPTAYYDIDHIIYDDNELFQYVNNTIMELVNCCWFHRQHNIKKISMSRVLKKPHPCQSPKLCTCCCSQIRVQNDDSSNISARKPYWPIQNDNTFMHVNELDRSINNAQTLIIKALAYSKEQTKVIDPPSPHLIKKAFNLTLKSKKETEFYMSGYNYDNDNMTASKKKKCLSVCCWYKRHRIASDLEYPESTLISESHRCPAFQCCCCCRPTYLDYVQQTLPINLRTGRLQNYRSKFVRSGNFHAIQSSKNMSHNHIGSSSSLTSTAAPILHSHFSKRTSFESPIPPVVCNQANIQLPDPLADQEPNIQIITNKSFQDPALKDPVVSSIFTSILDKYKNIRLTVDSRGLVSAKLDIPLDKMSTEDLKLLADLLRQVQKQVDSLKEMINPLPAENVLQNTNPSSTHAELLAVPIVCGPPDSAPQNIIYKENKSEHVNFDSDAVDGKELPQAYKYLTQIKTEQYRLSFKSFSRPPGPPRLTSEPVTQWSPPIIQNVFSLKDLDAPSTSGIKRKGARKAAPAKRLRVKTPAELAGAAAAPPQNANKPTKATPTSFNEEFCKFIQPPVNSITPTLGITRHELRAILKHQSINELSTVPPPLAAITCLVNNVEGSNPVNTTTTMPCLTSNSVVSNPTNNAAVPMTNQNNELAKIPGYLEDSNIFQAQDSNKQDSTNITDEECILGY